jgi:2-keto-4-pentenoate hydratase/2-oxohepta-3-ene-1,7-dioic acid hydratase in catechol pathway
MRLVTFSARNDPTSAVGVGALVDAGASVLDFRRAALQMPGGTVACFDLDAPWLPAAFAMAAHPPTEALVPIDAVRLRAPVPRPGKLVCVGLNYRDHAAESKVAVPERPVLFSKFTTSVIGPGESIVIPSSSEKVDYEAELAIVIGRRAKRVSREEAAAAILGYTMVNDVSARDFQFGDGQWQRGKSCDTFAPMGPWILTADEVGDPQQLGIRLRLNGQTLQSSNTNQMIFGPVDLVAYISETITLEPGDVIATGTPSGVGFARQPPVFLKAGDQVEMEVDGLGVLKNSVRAERSGPG